MIPESNKQKSDASLQEDFWGLFCGKKKENYNITKRDAIILFLLSIFLTNLYFFGCGLLIPKNITNATTVTIIIMKMVVI